MRIIPPTTPRCNVASLMQILSETFTSSFSKLWQTLITVAKDENAGEIICLLSAIDECEVKGRSQQSLQPPKIPGLLMIHLSAESDIEIGKDFSGNRCFH